MGSRTRTSTTTRKQALKKRRAELDQLTTREAQVLRMRHGVTEPLSAQVGRPASSVQGELRERVQAIENEILERLRNAEPLEDPPGPEASKKKIVKALKKRK
jgi:DNA-directed RNA polymerase sigma subunit (sigma70/sigma32)